MSETQKWRGTRLKEETHVRLIEHCERTRRVIVHEVDHALTAYLGGGFWESVSLRSDGQELVVSVSSEINGTVEVLRVEVGEHAEVDATVNIQPAALRREGKLGAER